MSFYSTNSATFWMDPFSEDFQLQFPPPAEIPFSSTLAPASSPPRRPSIIKTPSGLARRPTIEGDHWFPAVRRPSEWEALDGRRLSSESVGRRPSRTFSNDWFVTSSSTLARQKMKSSVDFAALPPEEADRAFAELQKRLEREYDRAEQEETQGPHLLVESVASSMSSPDRASKPHTREKRSSSSIKRATAGLKKDSVKAGGPARLVTIQDKTDRRIEKPKHKKTAAHIFPRTIP